MLVARCVLSLPIFIGDKNTFSDSVAKVKAAQQEVEAQLPQAQDQRTLDRARATRPTLVLALDCFDRHTTVRCAAEPTDITSHPNVFAQQVLAEAAANAKPPAEPKEGEEKIDLPIPSSCEPPTRPAGVADKAKPEVRPEDMLAAVDRYSKALAAITNAKGRAEFDAASTALASSASALAGLMIGGPAGAGGAAVATAIIEVARYGLAVSLDARRLRVLRCATLRAQEPVAVLGPLIAIDLDAQISDLLLTYAGDARYVRAAMSPREPVITWNTSAMLIQSIATKINALRSVRGVETAKAMVHSHNELASALRTDDGRQAVFVATTIGDFAQKAGDLQQKLASR